MPQVVSCFDTRVYDENTSLFAGDGCRLMYVLVTGRVLCRFETFTAAFKKTTCQRYLGPGSVLGMGVLAGSQTPDLLCARTTERSIIMTWRDTALETGHLEPYQNSIKGAVEGNLARAREYVSVDNLKKNWLLSLVPANVLAVLASVFRLRVVGKGGLILSAEEGAADRPADTCVILVSGSALVSTRLVDGQVRAHASPGLDPSRWSAALRCSAGGAPRMGQPGWACGHTRQPCTPPLEGAGYPNRRVNTKPPVTVGVSGKRQRCSVARVERGWIATLAATPVDIRRFC